MDELEVIVHHHSQYLYTYSYEVYICHQISHLGDIFKYHMTLNTIFSVPIFSFFFLLFFGTYVALDHLVSFPSSTRTISLLNLEWPRLYYLEHVNPVSSEHMSYGVYSQLRATRIPFKYRFLS